MKSHNNGSRMGFWLIGICFITTIAAHCNFVYASSESSGDGGIDRMNLFFLAVGLILLGSIMILYSLLSSGKKK